jgi:hypothetical protein
MTLQGTGYDLPPGFRTALRTGKVRRHRAARHLERSTMSIRLFFALPSGVAFGATG